jgi:hypothetical protein
LDKILPIIKGPNICPWIVNDATRACKVVITFGVGSLILKLVGMNKFCDGKQRFPLMKAVFQSYNIYK